MGKVDNPGKGVFLQEFMQDLPREMTAATVPIPAHVIWSSGAYTGASASMICIYSASDAVFIHFGTEREKVKLNVVILRPPSARVEMTASWPL
jgi:hypothetical protein